MRIHIVILLAVMTTSALAQPAEYLIRLTPQQLNIVGAALFERPYKEVAELIAKLQQEAEQQNKAAKEKETAK